MQSVGTSGKRLKKRSSRGILFGIPLLLFVSGIVLMSIGSYNYLSYAVYLSRLFIHDEVKPVMQPINLLEKTNTDEPNEPILVTQIQFPSLGDQFGELVIESADIRYPVIHGDRDEDLLLGIGHYNGSRYPGEGGNIVLAGHRNSVFKPLKEVKIGDTVIFEATYGRYVYTITDIRITHGNDKSIVEPSEHEKLTLYTCYPFNYIGNAPNRYVVTCEWVEGIPLSELLEKGVKTP